MMVDQLIRSLPEQFLSEIARDNCNFDQQSRRLRELERLYALTLNDNRRLRVECETLVKRVDALQAQKATSERLHSQVTQELRTENKALLTKVAELHQQKIQDTAEIHRLVREAAKARWEPTNVPLGGKICMRCGHIDFRNLISCPGCFSTNSWKE